MKTSIKKLEEIKLLGLSGGFYALVEVGSTKYGKLCATEEEALAYIESKKDAQEATQKETKKPTWTEVTCNGQYSCD